MSRIFLVTAVITLLLLTALNFQEHFNQTRVLGKTTEYPAPDIETVNYWQEFVKKHPTYFDGWWQLYLLTGNETYLNEALKIKPNYPLFTSPLP